MSSHNSVKQYQKDGFGIEEGYFYEHIDPRDLFDADESKKRVDQMVEGIDSGRDAWFGYYVMVTFRGHELGYANIGALYYKDTDPATLILSGHDLDGYRETILDEALDQAKQEAKILKQELKEVA
jgi:hypothetical protein